jgi:arginine-tRNA-protein transferase
MAGMEIYEFSAMIEETSIKSEVIEYYSEKLYSDPVLIGASLTDILDDGISMVYSFYDPEIKQNSFGKYIILDHIEYAKQLGLPYVYLGYWVPNSEKMGYKSDFSGIEIFSNGAWQRLDTDCKLKLEPDQPEPIAKQVANLKLPSNFSEI